LANQPRNKNEMGKRKEKLKGNIWTKNLKTTCGNYKKDSFK
jgi:hypothetical protein